MCKWCFVLTFSNLLWSAGSNVQNPDIVYADFRKTRRGRPNRAEKEDVSGETRMYGNPCNDKYKNKTPYRK